MPLPRPPPPPPPVEREVDLARADAAGFVDLAGADVASLVDLAGPDAAGLVDLAGADAAGLVDLAGSVDSLAAAAFAPELRVAGGASAPTIPTPAAKLAGPRRSMCSSSIDS